MPFPDPLPRANHGLHPDRSEGAEYTDADVQEKYVWDVAGLVVQPPARLRLPGFPVPSAVKYSDDQARDEHGRWTAGGGGEGANLPASLQGPRDSSGIQTLQELRQFAATAETIQQPQLETRSALTASLDVSGWTQGGYDYLVHAVRSDAELSAIQHEGLKPAATTVWASMGSVRDRGAGFVVFRAPEGEAKRGFDQVDRLQNEAAGYSEFTLQRSVAPEDIVRIVRAVPIGGGHTIREDQLAQYAADHQGLSDQAVQSLPEKYQQWFSLTSHKTA